jgi:hypothetical protein
VIQHVAYREEHYLSAGSCVRGIRNLLALGWTPIEVRGASRGPFTVLWRKDDSS